MGYSLKQIEAMNAADSIYFLHFYIVKALLQAMDAQSPFLITMDAQGTQGTPSYQVEIDRV